MGELQNAVAARLSGDFALTQPQPGGLGFGVYDHWLTKDGDGATPQAFTTLGRLKRSIVVLDPDEVQHPSGQAGWRVKRMDSFPLLYLFAEMHSSGRAALEAAYRRIEVLFHGWEPVLPSGERPRFEVPDGRTGARDDETFSALRSEVRLRATWARQLA